MEILWFVNSNMYEHQERVLVVEMKEHTWFIVVQPFLTYIHYLDQPSQGFNQSTKNQMKKKPLSLELYKVSKSKLNPLQT